MSHLARVIAQALPVFDIKFAFTFYIDTLERLSIGISVDT